MKVVLFAPPVWTPTMPHLALPSLTAYLRAAGAQVVQRDLNVEVFDHILTRDYLLASLRRLGQRRPGRTAPDGRRAELPPPMLDWARQSGPALADDVEPAKALVRGPAFYDAERSLPAFETLIGSLQLASLPHYPASLSMHAYDSPHRHDSSRALLAAVRDRDLNAFVRLFEQLVIPDVLRERPDVVGISIPSANQVIAAMTLGHLVKQSGIRTHVTVGGPMVTLWRELLPGLPRMFELFDSAVVFDGEEPLLRLCEALDRRAPLDQVPNLVYLDGRRVRVNRRLLPHRLPDLPTPDFDGLPLDRYLAPEPVLPLATTRGCYHGKCAFCNVGYGEPKTFSQMKGQTVQDQMLSIAARHGVRHFFFVDEALTPRVARDLSEGLIGAGADLRWASCARFENAFSAELLRLMSRAGCRMLLFGLETASPPIVTRMAKHVQVETTRRVLRDSAEAGISNHTFFFFGFPGETLEDAQATVDFVFEHGDHIHSASVGTFILERYAPAHAHPAAYGISRIVERPERDLAYYFDYEVSEGTDPATAETVAERFQDALPANRTPQFYVNQVYRFLHSSHLRDLGQPLPTWLGSPAGAR